MAVGASRWSWRIEEDLFSLRSAEKLVAAGTGDVAVLAFQSELCALVVIKQGWLPFRRVVAIAALRNLIREQLRELAPVDVFMALFALFRCLLEVHIDQPRLHVWRLVAVNAGDCPVRACELKRSRAVVEPVQLSPSLSRVAGFAAHGFSVLADLGHSLLELAVVHVFVTAGAG